MDLFDCARDNRGFEITVKMCMFYNSQTYYTRWKCTVETAFKRKPETSNGCSAQCKSARVKVAEHREPYGCFFHGIRTYASWISYLEPPSDWSVGWRCWHSNILQFVHSLEKYYQVMAIILIIGVPEPSYKNHIRRGAKKHCFYCFS